MANMRYKRSDRVAALLREELASLIEHGLKDPEIGFVTVTGVDVTDDLRHAKIFVVSRGSDDESKRSLEALTGAVPVMRRHLGRTLDLKYVPTLAFYPDPTLDQADRIQQLLNRIHEEEDDS